MNKNKYLRRSLSNYKDDNKNRIIYYYQTFNGLDELLKNPVATHIHLSAIHFGTENGKPYIHLNNHSPTDQIFVPVFNQLEIAKKLGLKIILMIGGAGLAYGELFSNYQVYYSMLRDTIRSLPFISGVDLDIEESVKLSDIKKLINSLISDFGPSFNICMAPLGTSLATDEPGMGGFVYKDLFNSPEGVYISYFNCQCYYSYNCDLLDSIVANGYPVDKIVMGMISGQYNSNTKNKIITEVKNMSVKYKDFGGVFDWEYFNAYPDSNGWSLDMGDAMSTPRFMEYAIRSIEIELQNSIKIELNDEIEDGIDKYVEPKLENDFKFIDQKFKINVETNVKYSYSDYFPFSIIKKIYNTIIY